jgi:hypothetical protein
MVGLEVLFVFPDLVLEFQGLKLFPMFQVLEGFVQGLKRFPSTEFVNPKGDVKGEKYGHGDGDDCHVVWFEPFVDFGCLEFLDVLEILGGDNMITLLSQFDEFISDVR